jgi:S1-C subfamily serine protease
MIVGLVALLAITGGATAQEKQMTEEQRREVERKIDQLRQELRELERQLGRQRGAMVFVQPREAPIAYALAMGRPRLGVIVKTERDPATDSIGAVLEAVTPEGPAARAGLQSGDIVVTFDGQRLATATGSPGERLIDLAGEMEEGDTVRIAVRRGKEAKTFSVVPKKVDDLSYAFGYDLMADSAMDRARRALERSMVVTPRLELLHEGQGPSAWAVLVGARWSDMELTTLDANLGGYFGTTEGLLVVRAPKDTLLGLNSGDVILRIGGRVPSSPSHAMRILRSYEPGDEVRIEIMRNKRQTEVKAIVPERDRGMHWEEKF